MLDGLALVGRHAGRGVALHVLDRAEAFLRRRAGCPRPSRRSGNRRRRLTSAPATASRRAMPSRARPASGSFVAGPGGPSLVHAALGVVRAPARSHRNLVLRGRAGHEGVACRVPAQPAAGLREQMHRRCPPAGHQQQVAGQAPRARRDHHPAPRRQALAGEHLDAAPLCCFAQRRRWGLPLIDDGGHRRAGILQVERRVPAGGMARGHHGAPPRQHPEPVQIGARRRGEHHARPVVAAEQQRALDRAGGQHDALRPHLPQPLADRATFGKDRRARATKSSGCRS